MIIQERFYFVMDKWKYQRTNSFFH